MICELGGILMQNKQYTEADWKLFRIKIVEWQEVYMNKLNEEYIALLKEKTRQHKSFGNVMSEYSMINIK